VSDGRDDDAKATNYFRHSPKSLTLRFLILIFFFRIGGAPPAAAVADDGKLGDGFVLVADVEVAVDADLALLPPSFSPLCMIYQCLSSD
jgi:hypothetical protein